MTTILEGVLTTVKKNALCFVFVLFFPPLRKFKFQGKVHVSNRDNRRNVVEQWLWHESYGDIMGPWRDDGKGRVSARCEVSLSVHCRSVGYRGALRTLELLQSL